MGIGIVLLSGLVLAYANGANDNFKGVATLLGSGTANYRRALAWATATTLLGSLMAVSLAGALLKNFSGKGLVDDSLVASGDYVAAVALGAGLTVLMATRIGMPVSTTHGLVGALVGAGFSAGSPVNFTQLGGNFFLPLLMSPVLAITVAASMYPLMRAARQMLGISAETCICVGNEVLEIVPIGNHTAAFQQAEQLSMRMGDRVTCQNRYQGQLFGIEAEAALDWLHYLSAGAVSFARGLNDTPKIAALLLVSSVSGLAGMAIVGIAIASGGIANARRVADTMSHRITAMNHGQGFTANLTTSVIVIAATRLGMPVSTTHVSCGALFGIGSVTRQARWATIMKILAAWITTLPLAACFGAASFWIMRWL
ncbi:MAG: inorganic phosphate transporter [Planctomycetes bacterium]|nr:inorganic phosphate transporter [Planctomycetota bacterium]